MWILLVVVVVAVGLMMIAGRRANAGDGAVPGTGLKVQAVTERGLHLEAGGTDGRGAGDELIEQPAISWPSIFEIVVTTRRELGRTWFGFELRSEERGVLMVDGPDLGQAFLAQTHRFPGFDHAGLTEALTHRRSRVVCYSR